MQREAIKYFSFSDCHIIKFVKDILTFKLIKGDLMIQNSNAIVNAANGSLWLGSGVAGAIRRVGGSKIQEECCKIRKEILKRDLNNGEVIETGIGDFKNENLQYIFHAVGPVYCDGKRNEENELYNAFMNCFKLADKLKLQSISLPPISSGVFGYPKDECAKVFNKALLDYVENRLLNTKSDNINNNNNNSKNNKDSLVIETKENLTNNNNNETNNNNNNNSNINANEETNINTLKEIRMVIIDLPTYIPFEKEHLQFINQMEQQNKEIIESIGK